MKKGNLLLAVFKALLAMGCMFVIGYLGYHYPDSMIWVVCIGVFSAFSWYFYRKDHED
ncbi:MAG: hypothetical protein ACHQET_09190 [Chitinophagales bacterium]